VARNVWQEVAVADITKCNNSRCPLKEKCWRWAAPAEPLSQSYFAVSPGRSGKCEKFWPIDTKRQQSHVSADVS